MSELSAPTRVDVWMSPPMAESAGLAELLDDRELAAVVRLRDRADRVRAVTARALLRAVCGAAFELAPSDVRFAYECAVCGGEHGKPRPVGPDGGDPLHVSVSRAGDRVVVASSRQGAVGVDVERCGASEFAGFDAVALTGPERLAIARCREGERAAARTNAWVRKEALLKLHGVGLSRSPSAVDVRYDVVRPLVDIVPAGPVRLTGFDVGDDYRACVATATAARADIVIVDARPVLVAAARLGRTARA